jgi:DNA helicase-2/ATP-dependent DNA helicase PcrA
LFRDNPGQLARELADLLDAVFNGRGFRLPGGQVIQRDPTAGTIGDCAVLAHSVREYKSNGTTPRFPLLLRRELELLASPLRVFNPRGRPLTDIDSVQVLCGLMLECIDPGGTCQAATRLPAGVAGSFATWRAAAQAFVAAYPNPQARTALRRYLQRWAGAIGRSNTRMPVAELVYDLVYWLEPMQGNIEGLVHLEVIQRTITESARFGTYGGAVALDARWHQSSVKSAFWDVFVPIADGAVEIDEDLLETLPTDRLNLMTVHQAKGLEFPFVIVDIGVDNGDRRAAPKTRFPRRGEDSHALEDELRQFSVGLGPPARAQVDRAFDDSRDSLSSHSAARRMFF